jgi:hypothetical protein
VLAPPLCVAGFIVAALLRPGYNSVTQFGSELEIGPGGWLQQTNFLFFGALELAFALGVALRSRSAVRGRWALGTIAALIAIFALGWITVGLFFDEGALTYRTRLHIWGTRLFLGLPIACFVLASRLPAGWLRTYSLVTGVLGVVLAPGLYTSLYNPAVGGWIGLYQRSYYFILLAWLEVLALRPAAWLNQTSTTGEQDATRG